MTSRAAPGAQPAPAPEGRVPGDRADAVLPGAPRIVSRLAVEFPAVDRQVVDRQVRDSWYCALHLGADVTPDVVEDLAREHLIALAGSLDLIRPAPGRDGERRAQR